MRVARVTVRVLAERRHVRYRVRPRDTVAGNGRCRPGTNESLTVLRPCSVTRHLICPRGRDEDQSRRRLVRDVTTMRLGGASRAGEAVTESRMGV